MSDVQQIPTVDLPGGGAMPMLGFGTWNLRGRDAYDAVRYALEAGYRHLDTATMYGNEEQVGKAVRDSGVGREEVFVTTKLPPGDAGREQTTIDASLRALGTDYVDLWLVHWPPPGAALRQTWRAFLAVRDAGLARAIGVSNHSPAQLDELTADSGETPAVNQIPWSPAEHDPAVLAAHRERGVAVEGYSPLKQTRLDHPTLVGIAYRHGVSPAQVVLRWHLEHGVTVIPKSATPARIDANRALFGFTLSPEEVKEVDSLGDR